MKLEVVIESFEELLLAKKHNVDRVELVSALDLGGLTPSLITVNQFASIPDINLQVMIRPRPGGFCYSTNTIKIMQEEIRMMSDLGVRGVVFGCLDEKSNIDRESTEKLLKVAYSHGLETTFNRAFDFCKNQDEALLFLNESGLNRILSSGSVSTIESGYENLNKLIRKTKNKLGVIAAGGINNVNIIPLFEMNLESIHFAIRKKTMENFFLGNEYTTDEQKLTGICNKRNNHEIKKK